MLIAVLHPLIRATAFEMSYTCFTTHPSNSWADYKARKWTI